MDNVCENCGTSLSGGYCSRCGQSGKDFNVPIGSFARDVASEALGLDSRIRSTLPPLFLKPGEVPRQYVEGRRARFVPPVRLYILASLTMFVTLSFGGSFRFDDTSRGADSGPPRAEISTTGAFAEAAPDSSEAAAPDSSVAVASDSSEAVAPGLAGRLWEADDALRPDSTFFERLGPRMVDGLTAAQEDPRAFTSDFLSLLARAMFVLMPAFAVLLKVLYRRRLYVQHLVFAIYYHGYVFLLVGLIGLLDLVGLTLLSDWLSLLLVLGVHVYLFMALRRFYGGGRIKTFLKFVFLTQSYFILSGVTLGLVFVLTILGTS